MSSGFGFLLQCVQASGRHVGAAFGLLLSIAGERATKIGVDTGFHACEEEGRRRNTQTLEIKM